MHGTVGQCQCQAANICFVKSNRQQLTAVKLTEPSQCTHQGKPAERHMSEVDIPAVKDGLKFLQVRLAVVPHLHSTLRSRMHKSALGNPSCMTASAEAQRWKLDYSTVLTTAHLKHFHKVEHFLFIALVGPSAVAHLEHVVAPLLSLPDDVVRRQVYAEVRRHEDVEGTIICRVGVGEHVLVQGQAHPVVRC